MKETKKNHVEVEQREAIVVPVGVVFLCCIAVARCLFMCICMSI